MILTDVEKLVKGIAKLAPPAANIDELFNPTLKKRILEAMDTEEIVWASMLYYKYGIDRTAAGNGLKILARQKLIKPLGLRPVRLEDRKKHHCMCYTKLGPIS